MKKRWHEFKEEMKDIDEVKISFIDLSAWLQEWAMYIAKGGVRPNKPH